MEKSLDHKERHEKRDKTTRVRKGKEAVGVAPLASPHGRARYTGGGFQLRRVWTNEQNNDYHLFTQSNYRRIEFFRDLQHSAS